MLNAGESWRSYNHGRGGGCAGRRRGSADGFGKSADERSPSAGGSQPDTATCNTCTSDVRVAHNATGRWSLRNIHDGGRRKQGANGCDQCVAAGPWRVIIYHTRPASFSPTAAHASGATFALIRATHHLLPEPFPVMGTGAVHNVGVSASGTLRVRPSSSGPTPRRTQSAHNTHDEGHSKNHTMKIDNAFRRPLF